jgi:hypothetical protein
MTDQNDQAMETAYLALGRLIAAECPGGFETASLRMETRESGTRLWITALLPDGTKVQSQPGAGAALNILESLRSIGNSMAREDGAVWQSCDVTLKAGGHFAMEVEY